MQDIIVNNLVSELKIKNYVSYPRPSLSGDSWLIAQLTTKVNTPIIIFVINQVEAKRLTREIHNFNPNIHIKYFEDWETLPYETFSPSKNIVSNRLNTLYLLMNNDINVLIISITTAIQRICPPNFISKYTFYFKVKNKLNEGKLKSQFLIANYRNVKKVTEKGEFSIRGSVIDIFPMGSSLPYRIDLFDDVIDSIYTFDVNTQRSLNKLNEINILPGNEFTLSDESISYFRTRFRQEFDWNISKTIPYRSITEKKMFPGIEYYLPLFFENTASIFDYINEKSLCIINEDLEKYMTQYYLDIKKRYSFLINDVESPALKPELIFLDRKEFLDKLNQFKCLKFESLYNENIIAVSDVGILKNEENLIKQIRKIIKKNNRIIFCIYSAKKFEILSRLMNKNKICYEIKNSVVESLNSECSIILTKTLIHSSFKLNHLNITFISENDLYSKIYHNINDEEHNEKIEHNIATNHNNLEIIDLEIGDPIVHVDYGIGRYNGMIYLNLNTEETEFLQIEYANKSNLYVPIQHLYKISRYQGIDQESIPLHQLGTDKWQKSLSKAKKQIQDIAAELLDIYSKRSIKKGFQFKIPEKEYQIFTDLFDFEETPDQLLAINAVLEDMKSNKVMDRLICGDVGFGKTEVALRATFVAVLNNKQVAILCPTTLLAEQHMQTFSERFAHLPVNIIELSRFKTNKEIGEYISQINSGKIDIVVGTHKIFSKNIKFKNLGLLIIDEEHRFGVRQKEFLKNLHSEIDIISLTATPIPRTLGMALEGIRDFSIITTPPNKRLSIKTFIRKNSNDILKEAITREINRGGQVYFVHNDINTIYTQKNILEQLMPEITIGIAHGQMQEKELALTMQRFHQQKYNILLCTTIIETGIDIPNANTIIIDRADRLGLAQLHQLRGRVGRSYHQAYAYLMIPNEDEITKVAHQRLDVIKKMEDLGSGFYLSVHDLEIRGSGQILGDSQSGNIQEIGMNIYNQMLSTSIKYLQEGKQQNNNIFKNSCDINLHVPTLLPSSYCDDIPSRLSIYKRLSHITDLNELIEIKYELIDRFGKLPRQAHNLLLLHEIRLLADSLKMININIGKNKAILQFDEQSEKLSKIIINLVVQKKYKINFKNNNKIEISIEDNDIDRKVRLISNFLEFLKNES